MADTSASCEGRGGAARRRRQRRARFQGAGEAPWRPPAAKAAAAWGGPPEAAWRAHALLRLASARRGERSAHTHVHACSGQQPSVTTPAALHTRCFITSPQPAAHLRNRRQRVCRHRRRHKPAPHQAPAFSRLVRKVQYDGDLLPVLWSHHLHLPRRGPRARGDAAARDDVRRRRARAGRRARPLAHSHAAREAHDFAAIGSLYV